MGEALRPLAFLAGRHLGAGHDGGRPVTARAEGWAALDGTWLLVREHLPGGDGAPPHEDLCLYRYDPQAECLMVLHCLPGGWRREYPVEARLDGTVRWLAGPLGPRVALTPVPGGYTSTVWLPGEETPSVRLSYQRVEGP